MLSFLIDILKFDSTSGKENDLAKFIAANYKLPDSDIEIQTTSEGRLNVFFKYGEPKIVFCSHLDTVPHYIAPRIDKETIYGRGSCDAKGQLAYLYEACSQLHAQGYSDFGLLMVSGEEDGSQGAIKANETLKNTEYIIIGEPTENKLIKASKGNLLVKVSIKGKSCHSGYPEYGDNAINRMRLFLKNLDAVKFPLDNMLGETTYNIGKLESDNAQNVVSDLVNFNLYFRTTFASHEIIKNELDKIKDENTDLEFCYGDVPLEFVTLDGFETDIVSYGTDAPSFTNVKNIILYGPGNILHAHTEIEQIKVKDIYISIENVILIYKKIINSATL